MEPMKRTALALSALALSGMILGSPAQAGDGHRHHRGGGGGNLGWVGPAIVGTAILGAIAAPYYYAPQPYYYPPSPPVYYPPTPYYGYSPYPYYPR